MGLVGAIRPYKLCRYLPGKGWVPEIITVHPRKGLSLDLSLLKNIPNEVVVHRTKNFDPTLIYNEYRNRLKRKEEKKYNTSNKNFMNISADGNNCIYNILYKIKNILLNFVSIPDHQVFWNIFILLTGFRILRREKDIQFIMVSSPPHSSQAGGMLLSILFKKPFIVDFRDPWNDIFVIKKSWIRRKIEESLESCIINKAKYVISTSETYANMLKKRLGRNNDWDKYLCITNSFEKAFFDSINPISSPVFTMSYLGIFYPQYNPYYFFKVLSLFIERYNIGKENLSLKIIGDIDKSTRNILEKYNLLEIVDITGRVNHEEAIRIVKSSDLLLLLMGTTELTPKGWIPSKLIEYVACGKPILGIVPEGEAAEIIRKTKTGYVITNEDEEAIIEKIEKEYNWKKEEKKSAIYPDYREIDKFSNDYTIKMFSDLFNSIIIKNINES